jgi:hypothetical protein
VIKNSTHANEVSLFSWSHGLLHSLNTLLPTRLPGCNFSPWGTLSKVLSRAWSILDYTGLATLYLTLGRGEGSLMVVERREEMDDHIGYVYKVYIHWGA